MIPDPICPASISVKIANYQAPFPRYWNIFCPVDGNSYDCNGITEQPKSLPGISKTGTKMDILPVRATLKNDRIDLSDLGHAPEEKKVALVFGTLHVQHAVTIEVGAASDWWMEWYVNGTRIYSTMEKGNWTSEFSISNHRFLLPLLKGKNLIAIKVLSGSFSFRLWCGSTKALKRHEQKTRNLVEAANKRIARIRQGEIIIKAKPGTRVHVCQHSHAFSFGTAISGRLFGPFANVQDSTQYKNILKTCFNAGVHEDVLKWYHTEKETPGNPNYTDADQIVDWCLANGLRMRGHCLFWGVRQILQPWIRSINDNELREHIKRRAVDVTSRYRGRIIDYDLNNEMLHEDYYAERLGPDIFAQMAAWAKEGDTEAVLYLNDYDVASGTRNTQYLQHIRNFLEAGIPIGGIGCQCHYRLDINFFQLVKGLNALGQFRLPIAITEYDIDTTDEQKKAYYLDTFYRLCFGHPAVDHIYMWGFWEGAHWTPNAALWKKDWTPTPAAQAYINLVKKEWRTDTTVTTDRSGKASVNAFYGTYEIISGNKKQAVILKKTDGKLIVTI